MAYVSREIKDRVAIGDNCYIMTPLADGRIMLTPAPDEVIEEGTPINKELLQWVVDSIVDLQNRVFNNITANAFAITFDKLDGLEVSGVWNVNQNRIEC